MDKGLKLLRPGRRSFRDGSQWRLAEWREVDGPEDGEPCGIGLHIMICDDPLTSPLFRWPCVVWLAEAQGCLGNDNVKARYRRMRIIRNVTDRYAPIVRVNRFIRSIPDVSWLQPQAPEEWMVVKKYRSLTAAWAAAGPTAWAAAGAAAWAAVGAAAWAAAGAARGVLVADLDVDTTWLTRWWRAWELGYYPIREDGGKLVVARITGR